MRIDINYLPRAALSFLVPDEYVALIYKKGAFPFSQGEEVEFKIVDGTEVLHVVKAKVIWKGPFDPATAELLSEWSGEFSAEEWIKKAKMLTRSEPRPGTHEIVVVGQIQEGEVPEEAVKRIKNVLEKNGNWKR